MQHMKKKVYDGHGRQQTIDQRLGEAACEFSVGQVRYEIVPWWKRPTIFIICIYRIFKIPWSLKEYIHTLINSTLDSSGFSLLNSSRKFSSVGRICANWKKKHKPWTILKTRDAITNNLTGHAVGCKKLQSEITLCYFWKQWRELFPYK